MSATDDEDLRRAWAAAADQLDEAGTVAALLAPVDDGDPGTVTRRARALLTLGRPADALAVLPDVSRDDLVAGRVTSWADVIALACWAAQGDEPAMGALMAQGAQMSGPAAALHAAILQTAAEQAGRLDVSDQALADLGETGPVTERTFVRLVARQVALRDPDNAERATGAVLGAARTLLRWGAAEPHGGRRVRAVTEQLEARGDAVGAQLLTRALVQLLPRSDRLTTVHRSHPTERRPVLEHGTRVVGALVAILGVTVTVALELRGAATSFVLGLGLMALTHRLPTARYMSRTDDGVLRRLEFLQPDAPTGTPGLARVPWWLTLLLGVPLCLVVAYLVSAVVNALAHVYWVMSSVPISESPGARGIFFGTTTALTIVLVARMLRWRRSRIARAAERRRRTDREAWAVTVGACRCWTDEAYETPHAGEYLTRHLERVDEGPAAVLAGTIADGDAAVCPLTGIRWLVLRDGDAGGARYLLRGPAAVSSVPVSAELTGGYL